MKEFILDNSYPLLIGLMYAAIFGLILSSKMGGAIGLGIGFVMGKYQRKE